MSGFVYIWYDRKHKRFYVGSHWGNPDDGYVCSSQWMKRAYGRRPQDFKRRIISTIETTHRDLLQEEQRWLQMIKQERYKKKRYYNISLKTEHHWLNNEETAKSVAEKISKTLTGRKTKPHSEETKAKMRAKAMGNTRGSANKGRVISAEHRAKISATLTRNPLVERAEFGSKEHTSKVWEARRRNGTASGFHHKRARALDK